MKSLATLLLGLGLVLLYAPIANAQNPGLAYYGLLSNSTWCDALLSSWADLTEVRIAFLADHTFGQNFSCWNRIATDPRLRAVEIHLLNGSGLRENHLQPNEVLYGYSQNSFASALQNKDANLLNKLAAHFRDVKANIVDKIPANVPCFASPILEYDLSKDQWLTVANLAYSIFQRCPIVNSPDGFGPGPIPTTLYELHENNPANLSAPCVADNDGSKPQLNLLDFSQKFLGSSRQCEVSFYWVPGFNGNKGIGYFVPPLQRTHWPSQSDFWCYNAMLKGNRSLPPACDAASQ